MKRILLQKQGASVLDLTGEAFHLVRAAPAGTLAAYYCGTVPFVAAMLFFWSDMSHGARAAERLAGASLGMALLFFWMKVLQALFASQLFAQVRNGTSPPIALRGILRSAINQTILQSTGLFLLPIAALVMVPFGWTYAFYQNVTALEDGTRDVRSMCSAAWKQAVLWPGQNHVLLILLGGFGGIVFLNLLTAGLFAPQLLKSLFDISSVFSRSPLSMVNTTFFAVLCGAAYLCVDPLVKACYVLRCHQGLSLQTGADIRASLRGLRNTTRAAILLAVVFLTPGVARSESPAPQSPAASGSDRTIPAPALDRTISEVIRQPRYDWRMPQKENPAVQEQSAFERFLQRVSQWIKQAFRTVKEAVQDLIDWLLRRDPKNEDPSSSSSWIASRQGMLFLILAAAACAMALLIMRLMRRPARTAHAVASIAAAPAPDLSDEAAAADQLPENEWAGTGRDLLARGEARLAIRAFYFAGLAHLAAASLLTIGRSKSNRDYVRELQRRAHALGELVPAFRENVEVFDAIWYGRRPINQDTIDAFLANLERIRLPR